jgi:putative hydrolase of the HAD superfamily
VTDVPDPRAVLLDVGGVLLLPDHDRILGALGRAGFAPPAELLDRAHYAGAARLRLGMTETEWPGYWNDYLDAYLTTCGVPDELRSDARDHLASEFAVAATWSRVAPGGVEGLRALHEKGVRLGIVSNADGTVEQMLSDKQIVHVAGNGSGAGIEVGCIVDSTVVGVAKPDPRIFEIALESLGVRADDAWYVGDSPAFDVAGARNAGIRPFVLDPDARHLRAGYERIVSLAELSDLVRV